LFGVQVLGIIVTVFVSAIFTYLTILFADKMVGANISVTAEKEGLDIAEVGEVAYGLDEEEDEDKLCIKLCEYAAQGDLLEIKRFYRIHNSVEFSDYDDRTALHIAASEGHLNVAEFLVKKGVDVNSKDKFGRTPIVDALLKNHREVIRYLKQSNAETDVVKH
jgi:hypothetical protein